MAQIIPFDRWEFWRWMERAPLAPITWQEWAKKNQRSVYHEKSDYVAWARSHGFRSNWGHLDSEVS